MLIHIIDPDYNKRIRKFLNLNYRDYSALRIVDTLGVDELQNNTVLLTDDLTLISKTGSKIYYLSEQPESKANHIYKYQSFKRVLSQVAELKQVDNHKQRISAISSYVGGVGKTTVAQTMTKLLAGKYNAIYLPLIDGIALRDKDLSDFIFELASGHGAITLDDYIRQEGDIQVFSGFSQVQDLLEANLAQVVSALKEQLAQRGINELIIDLPPVVYLNQLPTWSDVLFIVKDAARHDEETAIQNGFNSAVDSSALVLHNRSYSTDCQHCLPEIDKTGKRSAFDAKLSEILKGVGYFAN